MSRDWQISLVGTVTFHLVLLFGFQVRLRQPARLPSKSTLAITLVAAPAPVVTPVIRPEPPVVPPPPKPMPPPENKPLVPLPVEKIVMPLVAKVEPAGSQSTPTPRTNVAAGDRVTVKPGLVPTTKTAQPDIHATPDYLKNPDPPYPIAARRRHQEGVVLLTVYVTAQGQAVRVEIKTSSGFPLLDEAALQAVRSWEFKPALAGSLAEASQIEVPVRFKLTD